MVKKTTRLLLGLVFLWVPLVLFTRAQEAFTLPKEMLSVSALVFLLGQTLFAKGSRPWRFGLVRWALVFFLWMAVVSLAVGLVPSWAFRGLVNPFLLAGTILLVAGLVPRAMAYVQLVHYSLFSGGLMALYGIAQALGWDQSVSWDNRFDNRVFSTLGNPNYLGGHLAALLPVAFVLGLRAREIRIKWSWLGLTALLFTGLLATRVRGSDLAFAGSFALLGLLFLLPWGRDLAKRNLPLLLTFLTVFFLAGGWFLQRHGGLSSFGASEVSVQQRLETYRVTWEIIKDHPWRGIGAGQLGAQYPRYQFRPFPPAEYSRHPYTYTEHVHNEFLQTLAEGGLPGLLLFLALLVSFVRSLFRFMGDPQNPVGDKELAIGVAGSVTAVLIQSLSNFPLQIAPTVTLFGLYLAAPLVLARGSGEAPPLPDPFPGRRLAVSLAGGALLLLVGLKALAASVAHRNTQGETALQHYPSAVYYGQRLTALSPENPKGWFSYGRALEGAGQTVEAIDAFGKAAEKNPNYAEAFKARGEVELRTGSFAKAAEDFGKAEGIAPNYAGALWGEAIAFFQAGQLERAAGAFERFLVCSPDNAQGYANLGVCDIKLGRKSEAIAAWKKARALNPSDAQVAAYLRAQGIP